MLLTRRKRQEYLKYLGYYNGEIDGIVGSKTRSAYKKLQNDFFVVYMAIIQIYFLDVLIM